MDEIKLFMKLVKSKNINNGVYYFNTIVDYGVYKNNGLFRMVNQAKLKHNKYPLKIQSNHTIKETLIMDYYNKNNKNNTYDFNNVNGEINKICNIK